jgi:integrase
LHSVIRSVTRSPMHKLPNLHKSRHGVYYIRQYSNGGEVRRSLLTKDFKLAKVLALRYLMSNAMSSKKYEIDLGRGIFKADGDEDHASMMKALEYIIPRSIGEKYIQDAFNHPANIPEGAVKPASFATQPKLRTKPFSVATELYLAEKKLDNSLKTINEKRSTYNEFIALFGDADTNSVGTETAISYKNKLISDGLSALRINKTLSFMKDFFAYAINHKLYFDGNPFENLAISKKSKLHKGVKSYEEFSDEELKLIFENHQYKSFLNKPDYYWLPFLGLFTGARIEELASLKASQIKQENGVWIFDILNGKNSNSIRKIPIHDQILQSGFFKYVESVKEENGQLFPKIKPTINGYSKNSSRRFGQYLELIGMKSDRKVFHSFRSTFINRMTYSNIHPAILMGIVGHYEQSKIDFSGAHFTNYQKKKPVEVLKSSIDRLSYELKLDF